MSRLRKNDYMLWLAYSSKIDLIGAVVGGWHWFSNFEKLEKEIKTKVTKIILDSAFEIEDITKTLEELISMINPQLTKEKQQLLLELLEFANSKDSKLEEMKNKLKTLIKKFQKSFGGYIELKLFNSPKEANSLLLDHHEKCGIEIKNEEIEKNLQYYFENDIA